MSLQGPLTGIPWAVGLVLVYLGLLGFYPQLADRTPQLARAGLGLLLLPVVVVIGVLAHALVVGSEPPFADAIFMVIFIGFTLGITLLGIASVRTRTPSRAVGLWLLAFAATWIVLLAIGAQNPVWVDSIISGTRAIVVLSIGYLLRTEPTSTDRAEPAPTEVRHG